MGLNMSITTISTLIRSKVIVRILILQNLTSTQSKGQKISGIGASPESLIRSQWKTRET